jgi:hypothetical protein
VRGNNRCDGTPQTKVVLPRVQNLPTMGETLILVYMRRIGIAQTASLDEDISCQSDNLKFSKEIIELKIKTTCGSALRFNDLIKGIESDCDHFHDI